MEVLDRIRTCIVSCYVCEYQGLVQYFTDTPMFCPICGGHYIGTVEKPKDWLK